MMENESENPIVNNDNSVKSKRKKKNKGAGNRNIGVSPIQKDENNCFYCGLFLRESKDNQGNFNTNKLHDANRTVDHIIPVSTIGINQRFNRLYCCNKCNQVKGDLTLDQFKFLIIKNEEHYGRDLTVQIIMQIDRLIKYSKKNKKRMTKHANRYKDSHNKGIYTIKNNPRTNI